MDAIKGLARRATQTFREKVSNADTTSDDKLNDISKKVRMMEKNAVTLSDKVLRAAKLIEELGALIRDIGEEFKQVPDLSTETQQVADDTVSFGSTLVQKAQEHQAPLKEHAFDQLGNFIRELGKLRDAEEDRKKKQLEYDFFRQKVLDLRKSPPKDFTRIPRNEQILESWRVELWKSTENNKAVASSLYAQGQKALDQSVITVGQVLNSFLNIAASGAKHTYTNARLPLYPAAPVLTPAPLPPNPLPPFQYPNAAGAPPPAQVNYAPTGQDYQSPHNPHGSAAPQPQQSWGQPQQQWGQPQQPPPQQQAPPQQQWSSQQQQQQQQPVQWQPSPQQAQAPPPQHAPPAQQAPTWAAQPTTWQPTATQQQPAAPQQPTQQAPVQPAWAPHPEPTHSEHSGSDQAVSAPPQ